MNSHLYEQDLEQAFAHHAGDHGASRERFASWRNALRPIMAQVTAHPQKEAEPIFMLPWQNDDMAAIDDMAFQITDDFETLVVAGMGGSSLSGETLAALRKPGTPDLLFIDNIDPHSIDLALQRIDWQRTGFLVISKSGNTVESLAQMAVLLRQAKARLSNYAAHFYVLTILNDNPLHRLAREHGMHLLAHDPDLGGRFSVFSSVGLLPAAVAGLDIRAFRAGTRAVLHENFFSGRKLAPAADSAALHLALMENHIRLHVMMHYGDQMAGLASWYRQCWGESLGKCSMATTPLRARGTTDQHSLLQLFLDGPKDKLFTLMTLDSAGQGEPIDFDGSDDSRLGFLKGRTLGDLMLAEQRATAASLIEHHCPVRSFTMKTLNEEVLGALLMHFTLEIMLTAQLLKVNAFDQPAVEQGKIFALHYLSQVSHQPFRVAG